LVFGFKFEREVTSLSLDVSEYVWLAHRQFRNGAGQVASCHSMDSGKYRAGHHGDAVNSLAVTATG
jgi:hypothetical protein